jgi:integrase
VPISANLYQRLRVFWSKHSNPNWLFPGTGRGWKSSGISLRDALYRCDGHITKASIWSAIRVASAEAGLLKKHDTVTCHTLRHSYATHMLEAGAHVRQVSAYLGHTTLKPTLVYLHLTEFSEQQARQALNSLAGG